MSKTLEKVLNELYVFKQKQLPMLSEEEIQDLKTRMCDKITKEVLDLKTEKIRKELKEKNKREKQKDKINEFNSLFLVGLCLAFITGLMINQATDILSFLKGVTINIDLTLIFIVILLLIIVLMFWHIKNQTHSLFDK